MQRLIALHRYLALYMRLAGATMTLVMAVGVICVPHRALATSDRLSDRIILLHRPDFYLRRVCICLCGFAALAT
jgi:hypothetical protein